MWAFAGETERLSSSTPSIARMGALSGLPQGPSLPPPRPDVPYFASKGPIVLVRPAGQTRNTRDKAVSLDDGRISLPLSAGLYQRGIHATGQIHQRGLASSIFSLNIWL